MIAPAMLCIMLWLGATSAKAMARPGRAGAGESLGIVLSPSLPMLLAAGTHPTGRRGFESE